MLCVDCNKSIQHKGVCDACLKVRVSKLPKAQCSKPIARGPMKRRYEFDGEILHRAESPTHKSWRERSIESMDRLKKYEVKSEHEPVQYNDPLLHKVYKVVAP